MESSGQPVTELFRKFHQCEMYTKQGRIAACLTLFVEVLEKLRSVPLIAKEKRELTEGIFKMQRDLAAHKNFKAMFGPVTFDDTDLDITLQFLKNLVQAHQEEIVERMAQEQIAMDAEVERLDLERDLEPAEPPPDFGALSEEAIACLEAGDPEKAREVIGDREEVIYLVIQHYNEKGIASRERGRFEESASCYEKALSLYPDDEHLHYNAARALYEQGQSEMAHTHLDKALLINPAFREGALFKRYMLMTGSEKAKSTDTALSKGAAFLKGLIRRREKNPS